MGLDFAYIKSERLEIGIRPHWSYGGFDAFRTKLAKEIGIKFDEMKGMGGIKSWEDVDDDIRLLLNHSDCDGELSCEQCRLVAPRLRELVKGWPDDDYDKIHGLRLSMMMDKCAKNEWDLRFE